MNKVRDRNVMKVGVLVISLLLLISNVGATELGTTHNFSFTLLGDEFKSLDEYNDKPILIDWTASWCPICEKNLKNLNTIYSSYENDVYFITLSYYGSGDDLTDVQEIKDRGPYEWIFGLDTENYAAVAGAANAYIWILASNLTVTSLWEYQLVSTVNLRNGLDAVLASEAIENTTTTQQETMNETISSTPTSSTTTTTEIRSNMMNSPTSTSNEITEEIETLDIGSNPLFLGFLGVAGLGVIALFVQKFRA